MWECWALLPRPAEIEGSKQGPLRGRVLTVSTWRPTATASSLPTSTLGTPTPSYTARQISESSVGSYTNPAAPEENCLQVQHALS